MIFYPLARQDNLVFRSQDRTCGRCQQTSNIVRSHVIYSKVFICRMLEIAYTTSPWSVQEQMTGLEYWILFICRSGGIMPPGPGNLEDAINSIHYITEMGSSLRIEFSWSSPEYFAPGSIVGLYVEFCVAYPGLIRNFHISPWRLSLTSPVFSTGLSIRPGKFEEMEAANRSSYVILRSWAARNIMYNITVILSVRFTTSLLVSFHYHIRNIVTVCDTSSICSLRKTSSALTWFSLLQF